MNNHNLIKIFINTINNGQSYYKGLIIDYDLCYNRYVKKEKIQETLEIQKPNLHFKRAGVIFQW